VAYRPNDDPERWRYGVLSLSWLPSLAHGLPVLEAGVSSPLISEKPRSQTKLSGSSRSRNWPNRRRPVLALGWPFHEVYAVRTREGQPPSLQQLSYVPFVSQARNLQPNALAHVTGERVVMDIAQS
jgi:hypothetical protein